MKNITSQQDTAISAKHPETGNNVRPDDGSGYFDCLERAIEDAGFNVEMRKRVLDAQVGLVPVMQDYLRCHVSMLVVSEVTYTPPLSYIYMANLKKYLAACYRDKTDEIVSTMRKNFRKYYGLDSEISFFGMRQGKLMETGGGTVTDTIKGGILFLEDSAGARMVVKCEQARGIGAADTIIVKFYYDGREDFAGRAAAFIYGLERFCRENPVYKRGVVTMHGRAVDVTYTPWEALKISGEAKRLIDFHIIQFIRKMKEFEAKGARTSRGIILSGPPGNGKTLLGRVLATNLEVPFIWVTARDLVVPESIEQLYRFAAFIAPCVVFIEDADLFLQDRDRLGPFSIKLGEFLNRIDGLQENRGVVTIITANRPEFMDEAVKNRPRRFDARIIFANPDAGQRREILEYRLRDCRLEAEMILGDVANRTEGLSCAHISELAERLRLAMVYNGREMIDFEMVENVLEEMAVPAPRSRTAGFIREAVS